MTNNLLKPVLSLAIEITSGIKALVYIRYQTPRYYSSFVILGGVILFGSLFNRLPDYASVVSPLIGFIAAYADNFLTCYFLAQKPRIYAGRQERQERLRTSAGYPPLLCAPAKIKLLSREGLKLYFTQVKPFSGYEGYKVAFPVLFLILTHALSRGQRAVFSWGLDILCWAICYLYLWNKKFFWEAADILNISRDDAAKIKKPSM